MNKSSAGQTFLMVRQTFLMVGQTFLSAFLTLLTALSASSGEPDPAKPAPPPILESDLQRVEVAPAAKLPWAGKPVAAKTPVAAKPSAPGSESPVDMSSGDLIIKANGPFTREEKTEGQGGPVKEWLTMNQDVEIEMLKTQSVLRGQTIVVVRDMKTDSTESLEAKGNVQMVSPDRIGRGELLKFEMLKSATGEVIKNQFMLVGDVPKQKKATLWLKKDPKDPSKKDVIQAFRFFRDEIADTFRASGAPVAVLTLDAAPGTTTPGTPPPSDSGLGGLNLTSGGKISINCEADIALDGASGKLRVARNAVLIKEGATPADGVRMAGDDATIMLAKAPPAEPGATASVFGDMKMLECVGHVEVRTGSRTILCDKMRVDMEKKFVYMEMNNSSDTVNVYNQAATGGGGEVMMAPKCLNMNMDTQALDAGGPMKIKPFTGPSPSNRGNGPTQEEVLKASASEKKGGGLFGDTKRK